MPITTASFGVTAPQWLGPVIGATKDKPVRIVFHNLLPTGSDGDLFLPTDSTLMGSGMGPMAMPAPVNNNSVMDEVRNPVCSEYPKDNLACFADNRATLHLHGGITPWISDGTPHQWITPAGENTTWPQGVSVRNVPDMNVGNAANDGVQTFYYTNQQSARLMFYHDHAWGITRLNVYAGEAAGYLITDDTEKALVNSNTIPGAADTIPLDRPGPHLRAERRSSSTTRAPAPTPPHGQDPTWDAARWGGPGNLWYHHVYMPAQNPGDPSGMSAYGRWMYGPWFWPPAADTVYGPIDNPYYDANCNLDDPVHVAVPDRSLLRAAEDPRHAEHLGRHGAVQRHADRQRRRLSEGHAAAEDVPPAHAERGQRPLLQLPVVRGRRDGHRGRPEAGRGGRGADRPGRLPDAGGRVPTTPAGPDWIQIGTEGGFLPAPTVVDGQQPTTWITDPTRFDVGNVDKHSLLLAPAERADVIVDFSKFAGKTLILYNDAPAAFPARIPSYDYYTGQPDLSPNGAPGVLPGYGPNTRTIMQVTIAATAPAPAYNLTALQNAFKHKADKSGVFESGQHPIIVGQAPYNSAYGTNFAASSDCNAPGSDRRRTATASCASTTRRPSASTR